MTVARHYPQLFRLFGGAFNQDWDLDVAEGGDWPEAIDHYLATHSSETVGDALTELDQVPHAMTIQSWP